MVSRVSATKAYVVPARITLQLPVSNLAVQQMLGGMQQSNAQTVSLSIEEANDLIAQLSKAVAEVQK